MFSRPVLSQNIALVLNVISSTEKNKERFLVHHPKTESIHHTHWLRFIYDSVNFSTILYKMSVLLHWWLNWFYLICSIAMVEIWPTTCKVQTVTYYYCWTVFFFLFITFIFYVLFVQFFINIYTVFRKKHPLTFSIISLWNMYRFTQNFQCVFMRN